MNRPSALRLAVAATFVAAMAGIAAYEVPVARMAFGKGRRTSVKKRIAAVQRACAEKIPLRFGFVTLNGYSGAPVDLKVVCLGDSFSRAPTAFLSVAVRDLTVIDPRQVPRTFRIADLVKREKPDIVLQMLNTSTLTTVRSIDGRRGDHVMFRYGLP